MNTGVVDGITEAHFEVDHVGDDLQDGVGDRLRTGRAEGDPGGVVLVENEDG